jgi:hypothetical protein
VQPVERCDEVCAHCAADASVHHLDDLLICLLRENLQRKRTTERLCGEESEESENGEALEENGQESVVCENSDAIEEKGQESVVCENGEAIEEKGQESEESENGEESETVKIIHWVKRLQRLRIRGK